MKSLRYYLRTEMDFLKLLREEREKARKFSEKTKTIDIPTIIATPSISRLTDPELDISTSTTFNWLIDRSDQFSIENYRLFDIPSAYYIPNAIDGSTEQELLALIEKCGESGAWKQLSSRRLQLHGKIPHGVSESTVLPNWLQSLLSNESLASLYPIGWLPNNVLINQYESDQGIMHHTDGPAYKSFVIIISLESECLMTFKPKLSPSEIGIKSDSEIMSICLQPRSIFVFSNDLYSNFMHGISEESEVSIGQTCPCINSHLINRSPGEKVCCAQILYFDAQSISHFNLDLSWYIIIA